MVKVDTMFGYDFYLKVGSGDKQTLYNIVPEGSPPPKRGYYNRRYIEKKRGIKFPDRYQPTLHGTRELYPHDEEPSRK